MPTRLAIVSVLKLNLPIPLIFTFEIPVYTLPIMIETISIMKKVTIVAAKQKTPSFNVTPVPCSPVGLCLNKGTLVSSTLARGDRAKMRYNNVL